MKKIIYILIMIVVTVALSRVFKFDILSNFFGYDVGGNINIFTDIMASFC